MKGVGHGFHDVALYKVPHAAPDDRRKRAGMNHVAFRLRSADEVDRAAEFLRAKGVTILTSWTGQLKFSSITDGTSNTLMFGEKHVRPNSLRGKNEDRSVFGGQNNSVRRMAGINAANGDQRPLSPPNNQDGALANTTFGGPHSGVCQFVFCDGSVKAINNNVDDVTLGRLAERADGLPITGNY